MQSLVQWGLGKLIFNKAKSVSFNIKLFNRGSMDGLQELCEFLKIVYRILELGKFFWKDNLFIRFQRISVLTHSGKFLQYP